MTDSRAADCAFSNVPAPDPDRSSGPAPRPAWPASCGSVGRARAGQRDCRLHHGEQHRPARRQRYSAADRLAGRQVVAGGIGRCRRLRRGNHGCVRRRIIRGVAARRAHGRRCVGVRVGPDNIARRGCRRVGLLVATCVALAGIGDIVGAAGAGAAGVWAGAVGIGWAAAIFAGGAGTAVIGAAGD